MRRDTDIDEFDFDRTGIVEAVEEKDRYTKKTDMQYPSTVLRSYWASCCDSKVVSHRNVENLVPTTFQNALQRFVGCSSIFLY